MNRHDRRVLSKTQKPSGKRRWTTAKLSHSNNELDPPSISLELAIEHQLAGRFDLATDICHQLLERNPADAAVHQLLGILAYQRGDTDLALKSLAASLAIDAEDDAAWRNFGAIQMIVGDNVGAIESCRKAIQINSSSFEAYNNLGNALASSGESIAARNAYLQSLAIKPDALEVLNNLALVLCDLICPDEAIEYCMQAITADPSYAEAYNTWGVALGMLGRLKEAEEKFRLAIHIRPDYAEARWHLANIKQFDVDDEDILAMEGLVSSRTINPQQRMHLAFSLGKALEGIGKYTEAFGYLEMANQIKRAGITFDIQRIEDHFRMIKSLFTKEFIDRFQVGCVTDVTPVFIVGMPRSGTTLVEQILSSHPAGYGAGELPFLRQTANKHLGDIFDYVLARDASEITPDNLTAAAHDYLSELHNLAPESQFVTDKMPHNFEMIGLIYLLFPNAKVINCQRDPMDNCLSIYKMHFSSTSIQYAYDQTEIAKYFNEYIDLMAHWARILPGFVLNVSYESLVKDQTAVTEALLGFCGLEWDEACLTYHKNARAVKTASFAQVRKPVYSSSVGLWRFYSDHLKDMRDVLNC